MNINNFTKEELAIIESFLESSNTISNIYENLYKLEISEQKDSNEYNKLITILKDSIKKESEKYQKANLTSEQKYKIIALLANTKKTLNINNIDSVINKQYEDKVVRRIINILINQVVTNINYTKSLVPEELFDLLNELGISINNNEAYKQMNNYQKIELAINNDILLIFLSLLQETLNTRIYSKYKNELIEKIYITSFIHKDIENILVENKFTLTNNVYISSKLVNDLLNNDNLTYNIIQSILVETKIRKYIIKLLEIKDQEYNDKKNNIISITIQCYIRGLLTFMCDDDIYKLNEQFHELIESKEYLKEHPKDTISETAIMNCFKNVKYDRTKKRTISFRPNN